MIHFTELAREPQAWAHALELAEVPVMRRTVEELARLRENEDRVVARDIARVLLHDPMFTLQVLRYLQEHRHAKQITDITTVEHALMMLGISPFFARFADLPTVESTLQSQPGALQGLMHVAFRAHRAALYAFDWAILRHDRRADEVAIAALLHDLAEMLLWCFAPDLALAMAEMMRQDATLRSGAAQIKLLGFRLAELQSTLIAQWHLAALLQSLMDDMNAKHPRVLNVSLAASLARHSTFGWDNPALPDDCAAIQGFLKMPRHEVIERVRRCALQAANACAWYHLEAGAVPEDLGNFGAPVQDQAKPDDSSAGPE